MPFWSILVRQGIIHSHLQLGTSLQATAVRITLSKTITLCSIYIPPSSAISLHDMDDLVRQLPTPYMLLGDFNSHNPLWGGNTIDGKGQRVEQFMDNHSLCFLNDGSYTYLHPGYGTYTAMDLTITQPNLLLDCSWRVLDDLCGSDHFPIVVKHQRPATGGREPGWRLKKADWRSFRTLCDERLTADINNSPGAIASFTDTLISIADETVPKSSATPKHVVNPVADPGCVRVTAPPLGMWMTVLVNVQEWGCFSIFLRADDVTRTTSKGVALNTEHRGGSSKRSSDDRDVLYGLKCEMFRVTE